MRIWQAYSRREVDEGRGRPVVISSWIGERIEAADKVAALTIARRTLGTGVAGVVEVERGREGPRNDNAA